jgi:cohesin complex subunit SCC1
MKTQLSDTSNILGQLELAPPTRRLMQLKETSGVDKMFSLTSRPLHNKALLKVILLEKIEPNHVSTI